MSKTVYWSIRGRNGGSWLCEFWTKEDKSNLLTFSVVTTEESKVRYHIGELIGLKKFELVFIKKK